jgi:nicotinamide-nucleotide amidase
MSMLQAAEIIAVGSEMLTPYRFDTNSLFLTGQLNELGIPVRMKSVVSDAMPELTSALRSALDRADLVIVTGGLGPTDDDLTREAVASVLGLELVEHAPTVEAIRRRFELRGVKMPGINRRQALAPAGARQLANPRGTAPGLWIDAGGRVLVLLPGPPRELQPMFTEQVAPEIARRAPGRRLRRRVIKVTGRSESQVEEVAQPIYAPLKDGRIPIETTILASPGQIELHLSTAGEGVADLDEALDEAVRALTAALGSVVFSTDGRSLEAVVGDHLRDRGWRVAAAESCTGGLLLGRLTDVPGSSAWVLGGVIAYANAVKIHQLGVPAALIAEHGAVSEPVAESMAAGVRRLLGADVGVGITGIAGPDGGSDEKPVGTVVIAVSAGTTEVKRLLFPGDRQMVRQFATAAALDMIRRQS